MLLGNNVPKHARTGARKLQLLIRTLPKKPFRGVGGNYKWLEKAYDAYGVIHAETTCTTATHFCGRVGDRKAGKY